MFCIPVLYFPKIGINILPSSMVFDNSRLRLASNVYSEIVFSDFVHFIMSTPRLLRCSDNL